MTVKDFTELFKEKGLLVESDFDGNERVGYISYNSQDIKPDTLFFCKGAHFKEKYLEDALKKGSVGYVSEKKYNVSAPCILVKSIRPCLVPSAELFYGSAHKKLSVIGITGTKGKTTTAFIIKEILNRRFAEENKKIGFSSSVCIYDGVYDGENDLTTPEPFELHRYFNNAVRCELPCFLMEVSSQALKYDRVSGVEFLYGCYLNIGNDHISAVEHPDFEDYFNSKMKIFEQTKNAVVNLDADFAQKALECAGASERLITFSTKNEKADFYGYGIRKDGSETVFSVKCGKYDEEFRLGIPGFFNVENALCAIAVCTELNIPLEYIKQGVRYARSSGRMELHETEDKKIAVIVDYAHNKLSFQKLFESVKKEYPDRTVSIVFGSVGSKAVKRREDLGLVAGANADMCYLTADDPAEEEVVDICREIGSYIDSVGGKYEIVPERSQAILTALNDCRNKGVKAVVIVAGKGNEHYIKYGTEHVYYKSDTACVEDFIDEYNKAKAEKR